MHTRRQFLLTTGLAALARPGYADPVEPTPRLAAVREGVLEFLEAIRFKDEGWGRWPYHAGMRRPYALQSSSHAITSLEMLGALDTVPAASRTEAVAFLQGCQEKESGRFIDPLVTEADKDGEHSWNQIWGQWTGAGAGALKALGSAPLHPLPAAPFFDLRKMDGAEFTRSFDWSNPWGNGESWARAIGAYVDNLPAEVREALPEATPDKLRIAFETFEEEILDHKTGFPSKAMEPENPGRAMAGAFKTYRAYQASKRPWPVPQKTMDSTLAIQRPDGEFAHGGTLMNYDSIWVLDAFSSETPGYRSSDLLEAGKKLTDVLMTLYRKPDGGFALRGENCVSNHHSIILSEKGYPVGDTMGTRMCLNTLAMIDGWERLDPG